MRKYLAEIIGTFALVFCGTGAIIINQETDGVVTHTGIAITFGLIVASMIYALGDVSGAHLNPAVSIGLWLSKSFPGKEILPYVISQGIGAFIASLTLKSLFPFNDSLGSTLPSGLPIQSFVLELILTFFLMFVILQLSNGNKDKKAFSGLVIGGVVLLEAMFAGPISGASMNPIRSLSPAITSGHLEHLWVYIFAPIIGAALAVGVWTMMKADPNI